MAHPAKRAKTEKRTRNRSWCFTANHGDDKARQNLQKAILDKLGNSSACKFMIFQQEKGKKSEHNHFQGYIMFSQPVEFKKAQELLPAGAHLEIAKGSPEQNIIYCSKEEGRLDGPWKFGKTTPKQGKRTDIDSLKALIDAGASEVEIANTDFGTYLKYQKQLLHYMLLVSPSRHFQTICIVFHGKTGCGKTRWCTEFAEAHDLGEPYRKVDKEWFDGYQQEAVVILDDFYGAKSGMSSAMFLKLCDRYPYRAPIKGGHTNVNPQIIFMTSNIPVAGWYVGEVTPEEQAAIDRRCCEIPWPDDFVYDFKQMEQHVIDCVALKYHIDTSWISRLTKKARDFKGWPDGKEAKEPEQEDEDNDVKNPEVLRQILDSPTIEDQCERLPSDAP